MTEYEIARNQFIPAAVMYADKKYSKPKGKGDLEEYYNQWNRAFFGEMERLWAEYNTCPACGRPK